MNRTTHATELRNLSDALQTLHARLVSALRTGLEKLQGRIGPGDLLQRLLHDPLFAWLRPISGLIIEIDELADVEETPPGAVARIRTSLERWIEANANYRVLLQSDPDVAMAHAELRRQLAKGRTI